MTLPEIVLTKGSHASRFDGDGKEVPCAAVDPLGKRLRELRQSRGLSQEDLARVLEGGRTTAGAVGQFERGVTHPKPETLARLARGLDVEPDHFIEWRLARARSLLDEREVGLEEADHNLALVERALLSHDRADASEAVRAFESASSEGERASSEGAGTSRGRASRRAARAPRSRRSA